MLAAAVLPVAARAQGPQGPSPVGYTEVRRGEVRGALRLTGSVEARTSSLVASEVPGLVVGLDAREGDRVRRGQPIARLRRENLELRLRASEADLREARARLDLAQRNLERARDLFASGVVSRQQLDDAISEAQAWEGRVDSLEAEIALIQDDLERSIIRAPFTGVVTRERTEVGEWLDTGGPVVELADLEELEVVVEIPERHFRELRQGSEARVSFEAIPGLALEGRVSVVVPRASPQARTFPLKVRIPNRDGKIGAGMLARVEFRVGEPRAATLVPKDAVVRQGQRSVVYVIEDGGTVQPVEVEAGTAMGAWVAVDGDLQPGTAVVVRGNERLRPGQEVEGTPVEYELP